MKPFVTAALLALSCTSPDSAPLRGRWEGAVERQGAQLRTVVDIHGGHPLRGTVTSPDDLGIPRPLENIRYDPPRLRFSVNDGEQVLSFDGTRDGDLISGTVRGGELVATLRLRRTGAVPEPAFRAEEVRIRAEGATLAGTLLVPRADAPHPAVMLLHGSGPAVRASLRPIAAAFAGRGIAVLIYDKRGAGQSSGDWREVPFDQLADDARAAVEFLRSRSEIRRDAIGIWGGSEGGMVAPLAAVRGANPRFLILVCTIGVTAAEQDLIRIEQQMRERGFSDREIKQAVELRRLAHEVVRTERHSEEFQHAIERARAERWYTEPGWTAPAKDDPWWEWYRSKIDHDNAAVLEQVKVPVLVIFGGADLVVDVERNAKVIEEALRRGGNRDYTIRVFPGADHNLRLPAGIRPDTGRWDWPRFAPGALDLMVNFALQQSR